jgi:hypothetical protein
VRRSAPGRRASNRFADRRNRTASSRVLTLVIRRVLVFAGGVLLLGLGVAVAGRAAGDGFVPTVRCDEVVLHFKSGSDIDGNRVVLDVVSAPPVYLADVVRDPASAPFLYWRKAGIAIRASSAAVSVSVAKEWRDRVRIVWGAPGTPAATLRFAPCPSPVKTWNGYSGGFMLRTRSACVPLVFAVGDRRATLRFGIGRHC